MYLVEDNIYIQFSFLYNTRSGIYPVNKCPGLSCITKRNLITLNSKTNYFFDHV